MDLALGTSEHDHLVDGTSSAWPWHIPKMFSGFAIVRDTLPAFGVGDAGGCWWYTTKLWEKPLIWPCIIHSKSTFLSHKISSEIHGSPSQTKIIRWTFGCPICRNLQNPVLVSCDILISTSSECRQPCIARSNQLVCCDPCSLPPSLLPLQIALNLI